MALKACIASEAAASAMKLRWVSNAPLGFPVVPDVLCCRFHEVATTPSTEGVNTRDTTSRVWGQGTKKPKREKYTTHQDHEEIDITFSATNGA